MHIFWWLVITNAVTDCFAYAKGRAREAADHRGRLKKVFPGWHRDDK
jgi:hypothetical protein